VLDGRGKKEGASRLLRLMAEIEQRIWFQRVGSGGIGWWLTGKSEEWFGMRYGIRHEMCRLRGGLVVGDNDMFATDMMLRLR